MDVKEGHQTVSGFGKRAKLTVVEEILPLRKRLQFLQLQTSGVVQLQGGFVVAGKGGELAGEGLFFRWIEGRRAGEEERGESAASRDARWKHRSIPPRS